MQSGQVDGRCLFVAGGDASPLLQAVDAPFDGVALFVVLSVEGWGPAALAAATQPMTLLVCRDGDHCPDATLA